MNYINVLECGGNFLRMLVRPIVTVALVSATIYMATAMDIKEMQTVVAAAAASAVTFWFNDRGQQNKPAELGSN